MRRPALLIIGLCALMALPAAAAAESALIADPPFVDVDSGHPYAGDIRWMLAGSFTSGCNPPLDDRYCPDHPVTRGQMAVFIARLLDLPPGDDSFTDDDGSPFEQAIQSLAAAGITRGCDPPDNQRFCPDRAVSRAEMAAFLVRAFEVPEPDAPSGFEDAVGPFRGDIARLAAAGVTLGCNPPVNTRFCPHRPVTRAEMAAFLRRASNEEPVPGVPRGATFRRTSHRALGLQSVGAELCAGPEAVDADVVRPLFGTPAVPVERALLRFALEVDVSRGTYRPDRWSVEVAAGSCESIEARWSPGIARPDWPLPTPVVVSPFGLRRHPILGTTRLHAGVDLRASTGTPIAAAVTGTVTRAGAWGGYGNVVDVTAVGGMITRYAHLSRIDVAVGQEVEQGDVIGLAGCTGLCTGPHLHFELRPIDDPVDPLPRMVGPDPVIDPLPDPPD